MQQINTLLGGGGISPPQNFPPKSIRFSPFPPPKKKSFFKKKSGSKILFWEIFGVRVGEGSLKGVGGSLSSFKKKLDPVLPLGWKGPRLPLLSTENTSSKVVGGPCPTEAVPGGWGEGGVKFSVDINHTHTLSGKERFISVTGIRSANSEGVSNVTMGPRRPPPSHTRQRQDKLYPHENVYN